MVTLVAVPHLPSDDASDAGLGAPADRRAAELAPELLARCCAQDRAAFRAFVLHYQRQVFALLARVTGAGPHVDDLAQETFLKAYRVFPAFDPNAQGRASAWLLTLAVRVALDARRRRSLPLATLDDAGDVATAGSAGSGAPDAELERAELGRAIERAVSALPEDQRVAFVLAEYHEMSLAEIAVAVCVPEATVKTRLFRAREKLRALLASHRSLR